MWDRPNNLIRRSNYLQADPNAQSGVDNTAFIQTGAVPSARLVFSSDASNADTIGIGGKTFKFLTTLIAADSTVQVKRGTSAAQTLADLAKAINGVASSGHWVESTTPFALPIVADVVGTSLRIRLADARGGNPIAGASASYALLESITAAADIWNAGNLNNSGKAPSTAQATKCKFTVDAQMVTNGSFDLELPFTIDGFTVQVTSSAGVLRSSNEAVTASGSTLHFVMAGGASPNLQAGDIVTVSAWS